LIDESQPKGGQLKVQYCAVIAAYCQLSFIWYLPEIIQHAERFEGGKLLRRDGAQQVLV